MPLPRIIRNAARCLGCGDEIESTHRHDFVTCSCGKLSVDGGKVYTRRVWDDSVGYEELTQTVDPELK